MNNFIEPIPFKLISWNEAFEMIFENNFEFGQSSQTLIIEDSVEVYVYGFKDSTLIIPKQPNSYYSRNSYPSFLFYDSDALNKAIKTKTFPIPEEFITILEKEKDSIKGLNRSFNYYIDYFNATLNSNLLSDIKLDILKEIHPEIIKMAKSEQFNKLKLAYSIIIDKFLIQNRKAQLYLLMRAEGYTPFYVPCVKIGESIINPFENMGLEELKMPFEQCLNSILLHARPMLPEFKNSSYEDYIKRLFIKKN